MKLLGLKTTIRIKNYEASRAFYHELLSLPIHEEYNDEEGVRGCIFKIGDSESRAKMNYLDPRVRGIKTT